MDHHQREAPLNDSSVVIAPSGYTQTGCQVSRPAQFAYAAYHCNNLAQRASSLSLTSIRLPASERSHQQSPNQIVFQMQCHSTWPCSNPTRDEFIDAMARELGQHTELKHWKIIHKSQVPKNAKPIPMVWTLSRKRDPAAQILKWKARLCAGGHRQVFGDTYWTTFAPVVSWTTVWCVFIVALLLGWHMRSLDFMMAYTKLT